MINRMQPHLARLQAKFLGTGFIRATFTSSSRATAWNLGTTVALTVMRLASNLILARLLLPEAFGVAGLAFTFIFALRLLTDIGLDSVIIQSRRGDDPAFVRTVWVTQIGRNLIMGLLMAGIGLAIGLNRDLFPEDSVYRLPVTAWIIASCGAQMFMVGFMSPSIILSQRNLDQRKLSILEMGTRFLDIPAMIIFALLGFGAWALILGTFVATVVKVVASHFYLDGPKMAFAFEKEAFLEVFHFGKWLIFASAATALLTRADHLIFSGLFDSRNFSLYVTAGIWIQAIHDLMLRLVGRVAFPAISKTVRESPENIVGVYKRLRVVADIICLGTFTVLLLGHQVFFEVFYNENFEPAAAFVPFMAIRILFIPIDLLGRVALSAGDSRNYSAVQVLNAVIVVVALPLVYNAYGMMAAAFAFGALQVVTLPPLIILARRHMRIDIPTEARLLAVAVAASAVVLTFYR